MIILTYYLISTMSFHTSGKIIRSDVRQMVYNIIQYFEEEKKAKRYHPYKHSNLRISLATGLSTSTVSKIRKEGKLAEQSQTKICTPSKGNRGRNNTRVSINIAALCNIREIIASLYDAQEIPTIRQIISKAKKDFNVNITSSTLRRFLKNRLGFRYIKLSHNRRLLFESDSIKTQRVVYLRRIRNNDALKESKKAVIYIDESWFDVILNKIKGKKSITQRYFVIHAGSETEYLENAVFIFKTDHDKNEVDGNEFINYVKEILLPNLEEECILVVDDASCHNSELNKAPSRLTCKNDVKKWMVDNYITFDDDWTKVEMLEHIKSIMPVKKYALDELVTKYGHEVIRLPTFNFDLNPIERVWDVIKDKISKSVSNVDEIDVEDLAKKISTSVTKEWRKTIDNVKKSEKKYWLREVIREEQFESFIRTLGINSDDDSDDLSGKSSSSDESVQEDHLIDDAGEGTSK